MREGQTIPLLLERKDIVDSASSSMIFIRGGTFLMGSPSNEDGREKGLEDQHQENLADFYI